MIRSPREVRSTNSDSFCFASNMPTVRIAGLLSNYRTTMSCERKAQSLPDDLVVSAPPLCTSRLCVVFSLALSFPLQL
jgi:hypothetical protein